MANLEQKMGENRIRIFEETRDAITKEYAKICRLSEYAIKKNINFRAFEVYSLIWNGLPKYDMSKPGYDQQRIRKYKKAVRMTIMFFNDYKVTKNE